MSQLDLPEVPQDVVATAEQSVRMFAREAAARTAVPLGGAADRPVGVGGPEVPAGTWWRRQRRGCRTNGVPAGLWARVTGECVVAVNVRGGDLDQLLLMPPSVREWLPEEHLAFFVLDVVAELDLASFLAAYRVMAGAGRSTTRR